MQTFYKNLVLHIPHSSASMPLCYFQDKAEPNIKRESLLERSKNLIDMYVDELFASDCLNPNVQAAIFPLCRTLCDVERLPDDPLEEKNLGILYFGKYEREEHYGLTNDSHTELRRCYCDWQNSMARCLDNLESPLLLDCHSYSSFSTDLCEIDNGRPIDICIGFNDDNTKPDDSFISLVEEHFRSCGYRVGINAPFSNSKTFAAQKPYHSLMIEINKSLYMNETTLEKNESYARLFNDLKALKTAMGF